MRCNLCKYEWVSRVEEPKCCPRCKRYDWRGDGSGDTGEGGGKDGGVEVIAEGGIEDVGAECDGGEYGAGVFEGGGGSGIECGMEFTEEDAGGER